MFEPLCKRNNFEPLYCNMVIEKRLGKYEVLGFVPRNIEIVRVCNTLQEAREVCYNAGFIME